MKKIKCVVVGDSEVGKTCLVMAFCSKDKPNRISIYRPTVSSIILFSQTSQNLILLMCAQKYFFIICRCSKII